MQIEYPFVRYNLFYYVYVLSFYERAKGDPDAVIAKRSRSGQPAGWGRSGAQVVTRWIAAGIRISGPRLRVERGNR